MNIKKDEGIVYGVYINDKDFIDEYGLKIGDSREKVYRAHGKPIKPRCSPTKNYLFEPPECSTPGGMFGVRNADKRWTYLFSIHRLIGFAIYPPLTR